MTLTNAELENQQRFRRADAMQVQYGFSADAAWAILQAEAIYKACLSIVKTQHSTPSDDITRALLLTQSACMCQATANAQGTVDALESIKDAIVEFNIDLTGIQ